MVPPRAALLFAATAAAVVHDHEHFTPDYTLFATEQDIQINCQTRRSIVVNGTSPGPTLDLHENQTTWIRVYNNIPDQNFTLHWHGLAQRAAPFSDGTPLVSQWPIPPGRFFDYEIHPEIGDAGTYFYHSHVGFQQSTAHGALIVRDAGPAPYDYDDEILLSIGDFYEAEDGEIEKGLLADPFKWSGEPQAVLVNGKSGNASSNNATDESCLPYVIDVKPDKTYRIRAIGRAAISLVKIGIEGHDELTVIEADGEYTQPANIDHIQVAPGQRQSYLLRTKSKDELRDAGKRQFWVRYASRERPASITGYALLRYKSCNDTGELPDLPDESPVELPETTNDYLENVLQPLNPVVRENFPRLEEVTRTVTIQVNQELTHGAFVNGTLQGPVVWVQNNETWQENVQASPGHAPYLISYYTDTSPYYAPNHTRALLNDGFDPISRTFTAVPGEVIDIVWQSNSGPTGGFDFHPMHVHGEHVYDLGGGNGTYDAAMNEVKFQNSTYVPARRDTSILHRYTTEGAPHTTAGWRAWRIRITEDNVGAWMMHCHIAQHAVMGMNTVWVFGEREDVLKALGEPPYVSGYLEYGGDAYGDGEDEEPLVQVHEYFDRTPA
ncbi:multicopper oxidase-domain-containing protein [Emericellopsis atlantica]|uniref:Multicopper oxidase-domain-containing protein n=1 Tax=Emericellopsis atlantica TaxID=2614577 RepID=A0A9P8CPC9_9HYPO|nr:multicopper oxidase-domain-containing protein [Emericellopsis atlantica]KAG9253995.1 multicopper oxidase-domain-containing protein [Emericellopsis atlantica]